MDDTKHLMTHFINRVLKYYFHHKLEHQTKYAKIS